MSRGKGKRYKEEEIISILRESESGLSVGDLLRKHNISAGTYYRWKSQYSGMQVNELKRLKQLEAENSRLKRLVAEKELHIDALKDVCSKNWSGP